MRLLQYHIEHRREVAGRGIDDLQYFGGCCLLLQCLARLGQQPRILHRYDCLRGEILQQRDLFFRERPHLLPVSKQSPEQRIVFSQRNDEHRASTCDFKHLPGKRILAVGFVACSVGDLDKGITRNKLLQDAPRRWRDGTIFA